MQLNRGPGYSTEYLLGWRLKRERDPEDSIPRAGEVKEKDQEHSVSSAGAVKQGDLQCRFYM